MSTTCTAMAVKLSSAEIRKVAVEADTDPRTVKRVLTGRPTRGMTSQRIVRVLRRMKLVPDEQAAKEKRR